MEQWAGIIGLLTLASVAWGISGLIKPKLVLWWAVPEKRTRGRALGFAAALAFCLFCYALIWLPDSAGWLWIPGLIGLFSLPVMAGSFRMTKAKQEELVRERERSKKASVARTAYSATSDREYEMRPFLMICSCPDWEERRSFADGPFCVCKHLATHYVCYPNEMPDDLLPYKNLILSFSIAEKGIPPQGELNGYGVIDGMAYLFTGYADSLPWVNVYTAMTGTQRYGFNPESGKWAKGEEPAGAEALAGIIKSAHA